MTTEEITLTCSQCGRSSWSYTTKLREAWRKRAVAKGLCELCFRRFHGGPKPAKRPRCAVCDKAAKTKAGICATCTEAGYSAPTLFDQGES